MGWWSMNEYGGIARLNTTKEVMGDTPADIMDRALKNIATVYKDALDRDPTEKELIGCFNFCTGLKVTPVQKEHV